MILLKLNQSLRLLLPLLLIVIVFLQCLISTSPTNFRGVSSGKIAVQASKTGDSDSQDFVLTGDLLEDSSEGICKQCKNFRIVTAILQLGHLTFETEFCTRFKLYKTELNHIFFIRRLDWLAFIHSAASPPSLA